ncbi:equilibrative nucleobase transporter 1-like [Antedon mediterranea]|uniref:equilibrative nucleobase transporter 1-like n=1 Tax=Antedon mediterranea TaxID=105859 RepID=UPI003AF6D92D
MLEKTPPKIQMRSRGGRKRSPLIIIPAIFEGFFTTLVYGWPWLVTVLKKEGYYNELCDDSYSNVTVGVPIGDASILAKSSGVSGSFERTYVSCPAQDQRLNLVFTLASCVLLIGCLPTGVMYDLLGPRKIRLISCVLFATTFLMYGFSSKETPFWIFPATAIQGFIGAPVLVSLFEVANLFPNLRHTIISLLNGACMMSTVVYLIVQKLAEAGILFQHQMFALLGIYTVLTLGNTFFIVPSERIEIEEEDDSSEEHKSVLYPAAAVSPRIGYRLHEHYLSRESVIDCLDDYKKLSQSDLNQKDESFWTHFRSLMFLFTLIWATVVVFREYYFLGTLNPFLGFLTDRNEETVNYYTTLFGYISFGIVLVSPLVGVVLDGGTGSPLFRSIIALMITTSSCVLYSITVLIPILNAQLITFVLVTVNRGFAHAVIASFIAIVFPKRHFGKFYGLVYLSSGVSTFLQAPLLRLSQSSPSGNPKFVHIIILLATLLGHFLPFYVWIKYKRELAQKRQEKTITAKNAIYIQLNQTDSSYSVGLQTAI